MEADLSIEIHNINPINKEKADRIKYKLKFRVFPEKIYRKLKRKNGFCNEDDSFLVYQKEMKFSVDNNNMKRKQKYNFRFTNKDESQFYYFVIIDC